MRRVLQRGEEGCGIACVAMIARDTYSGARRRMPCDEEKGTTIEKLRSTLKGYGIKTARKESIRGRSYKSFEFDAALHGKYQRDKEHHWVVWDSKRLKRLDPYKSPQNKFICTSFVRILGKNW